jgi:AcrR family transcriptional regulator
MTASPAPRPARSAGRRPLPKSEATRERIIAAAAHVLVERGYAGTKLSDIAEQAGLRAGSLYYHFDDRDDIVDQVLRRSVHGVLERVRAAVEALPADAGPLDRLRAAIVAHLGVIVESSDVSSAGLRLMSQLPPEIQRRYREIQRRYGDYWHGLVTAAQRDGSIRSDIDPIRLRLFVIGQLNWVAEWPRPVRGTAPGAELADEAVAVILDGIATRR